MRVHPQADYSRPGWLRHEAHCLGMITGWGSHHYDTMHWALQFENTGPSRVEGKGEFPDPERIWNVHGAYDVTLAYPNNVTVNVSDKHNTGLKFIGDEGWIWVTREGTGATSSDPQAKGANLPPLDASDREAARSRTACRVQLPVSKSHHKNWLESVQSRKQPLAPAHVAHRSNTRLHRELDRHEAGPSARVGSEGRALQERRRSQRHAVAQRALAVRRAASREGMHDESSAMERPPSWRPHSHAVAGLAHAQSKDRDVQLITLDPGHFHAALVQKFMLPGVSPDVLVFAPEGDDVAQHLKRIEGFNTRAENPTQLGETVYTGPDYLERALEARRFVVNSDIGGRWSRPSVVVISGNNARKTEYITAVDRRRLERARRQADGHQARQSCPQLEADFAAAKKKGVLLYDIMTERFEITTMLQRALSQQPELFGTLEKGTPDNPSITKISVHNFSKVVAGAQLKRPQWFFDPEQQGAGIVDVMTHLVDLVQWEAFPGSHAQARRCEGADGAALGRRRSRSSSSAASPARRSFRRSSATYVKEGVLQAPANGEFTYTLKACTRKVSVTWEFEAPPGAGDTHFSVMRGTKASLTIKQGAEQGYKPVLYVERSCSGARGGS